MLGKKKNIFVAGVVISAIVVVAIAYGVYQNGVKTENLITGVTASESKGTDLVVSDEPVGENISLAAAKETLLFASQGELLRQLSSIIDDAEGTYGIYILELNSGNGFGINQDRWFTAASTVKVPLLAKIYQEIELGNIDRNEVLTFSDVDYEGGTGTVQDSGIGTPWTVADLAEKMMKESDNVAKNMLLRRLGPGKMEAFLYDQGSPFDLSNNMTTPRSMATMLGLIYSSSIVGPRLTQEILDLMTDTEDESRLPQYLDGVRVAHKVGTWEGSISDVGIVFLEDNPFVICVYSEDTGSLDEAAETIGRIAFQVYAYEADRW